MQRGGARLSDSRTIAKTASDFVWMAFAASLYGFSPRDVRYWHLADIPALAINVRFWGKADMASQRKGVVRVLPYHSRLYQRPRK
jgi:hypothetical protein